MKQTTRYLKRSLAVACGVLLAGSVAAQDEPELLVQVGRERIYEGESVQYQVVLQNVQDPKPPKLVGFDDFEVRSLGESDSRSFSMMNGQVTQVVRRAYNFVLTPKRPGTLQIPAPVAEVDGRVLRGHPLTLEVVAPSEQDWAVLEITADRDRVYPMQPFAVRLTVAVKGLPEPFAERNPVTVLRRMPGLSIPWADDDQLPAGLEPQQPWQQWLGSLQSGRGGFSVNEIPGRSLFSGLLEFLPEPRRTKRKQRSGQEADYWEFDFARTFTPHELGPLTFGPVTLKGVFVTEVDSDGQATTEDVYAIAKALLVTVQDAPATGRPDSYIHAIGKFTVENTLVPEEAKVGDPLTLTLTLRGQGTLDAARAPDLTRRSEVTSRFRVYEATEETRDGARRFTYSLRPLQAGETTFPAIPISYFDVDKEQYVTLRTRPLPIKVTQAEQMRGDEIAKAATPGDADKSLGVREDGILANVTDLGALRDQSVRPGRWLIYLAVLSVTYIGVALVSRPLRRYFGDAALQRRRAAPGRARQRLRAAEAELAAGRRREGAEQLGSALIGLVADVSGRDEAGMTSREVDQELSSLGIADELRRPIGALLETCDGARYGASADSVQGLSESAGQLLEELIRALKRDKRWQA
jgi:hypothetical protein